MELSTVVPMSSEDLLLKIAEVLALSSKSGWLGMSMGLMVSLVLGYLYVKIKKSRNSGAEETQKFRHTAISQIVTDNASKEAEHARAEAAVDDFLKEDEDGVSRKSLGDNRSAS